MPVSLAVANVGTASWADDQRPADPEAAAPLRSTRVVAAWIPVEGDAGGAQAPGTARDLVTVLAVPLAAGQETAATVNIATPTAVGTWALVFDVTDSVDGSFAALGSAPAVAIVEVRAPEGDSPVR